MRDSRPIKLVSSRSGSPPVGDRYRLLVSCHRESETAIHVYDRRLRRVLLKWRGDIARALLQSDVLLPEQCRSGSHSCDKSLIRSLTIAAAKMRIELRGRTDLNLRLVQLHRNIPLFHRRIAQLMFDHPGKHFSEQDIVCLLLLEYPCVSRKRITEHLDDLVRWGVIQCVNTDEQTRFYDIDTRPHLHIYCSRTKELRDAPDRGVIRIAG